MSEQKIKLSKEVIKNYKLFFWLSNVGYIIFIIYIIFIVLIPSFMTPVTNRSLGDGFRVAGAILYGGGISLVWLLLNLGLRNLHKKKMKKTFYTWASLMMLIQPIGLYFYAYDPIDYCKHVKSTSSCVDYFIQYFN